MNKKSVLFIAISALTGSVISPVNAAEYTLETKIGGVGEANDNITMAEGDEDKTSVAGGEASAELDFHRNTPTLELGLNTSLISSLYDEDQYNSDDQNLIFDAKKMGPRSNFGVEAGVTRDSTRTSELLDTGLALDSAERRESYWLAPFWEFDVTKNSTLSAGVSARDVSYDTDQLSGYEFYQANLTWAYRFSQNFSGMVRALGENYQSDEISGTASESDVYGLMLGGEYAFTPNTRLMALFGGQKVDSERYQSLVGEPRTVIQSDDNSSLVEMSLVHEGQRSNLEVAVSTSTEPSSAGSVRSSDRIRVDHTYRLTPVSRLNWGIQAGQRKSLDGFSDVTRDFAFLNVGASHRMSEHWEVTARYSYGYQDSDARDGHGESNQIRIGFTYIPYSSRWSR